MGSKFDDGLPNPTAEDDRGKPKLAKWVGDLGDRGLSAGAVLVGVDKLGELPWGELPLGELSDLDLLLDFRSVGEFGTRPLDRVGIPSSASCCSSLALTGAGFSFLVFVFVLVGVCGSATRSSSGSGASA